AARVDELVRQTPVTEPLAEMSAVGFRQLPDM
ncbi:MAG: hypothetical protein ACI8S3_001887, partial [Alphaproteobacteria bacterium]